MSSAETTLCSYLSSHRDSPSSSPTLSVCIFQEEDKKAAVNRNKDRVTSHGHPAETQQTGKGCSFHSHTYICINLFIRRDLWKSGQPL
ncbi:hypothetical protein GDO81_025771 [Engystomops pustulosus]|uniref:Uncharacterized protein n=1 Tax=Engystomops pustulosus TaxID=76066 RepID=A0AAV6ZAG9_ENGPU|nr:hypothetical protein GDO81_025771 [Engystomops pustulosus]KAG8542939.1 hypothetical protein GDO81_025771 [Engystomops pustulosus]